MKRLSLEDFKTKSENTKELESLTGGILGACHCCADGEHNIGTCDTRDPNGKVIVLK